MSVAKQIAASVAKPVARQVVKSAGGGGLSAAFSVDDETPVAGQFITFMNESSGAASYSWDFGDGTVPSAETNPTHYFVGNGPYTVTLTATDAGGNTATATLELSPTTPSASTGQTIENRVIFSEDLSNSNFNVAPFGFDNRFGNLDVKSIPVGGKLAATSGVGYHGESSGGNWSLSWDIGIPNSNGIIRQLGGWIYLEQAPSSWLGFFRMRPTSGLNDHVSIEADLSVARRDYAGTKVATFVAGPLPLKEWIWIGLAQSASVYKLTVRTLDGASWNDTQVDFDLGGYTPIFDNPSNWGFGPWNEAGNISHRTRISHVTLHQLSSLSDAGYPNEIVPPQISNHVYQVDPDSGDDANDGVTAAWQTVDKINSMFGSRGVISDYTANSNGSGNHLVIDTSAALLETTDEAIELKVAGTWLKPAAGQEFIEIKSYREIGTGEWSATGGYSNIYECSYAEPQRTTVFGNLIPFETVDNLAELDAAAGGASFSDLVNGKLYVKTLNLTNPASDGITYRHGRFRPDYVGDGVGNPVVAIAGASIRVTGCKIWFTAMDFNGCYAIGDLTGFAEGALVEDCDCRYGDKHIICYTMNATDTTITTRNCRVEQAIAAPLTDYMFSGSGNVHNWENIRCDAAYLLPRSADGQNYDYVNAAWLSHGVGAAFDEVNFINCQIDGGLELEGNSALLVTIDGDCENTWVRIPSEDVTPAGILEVAAGATFTQIPSVRSTDSVITGVIVTTDDASLPVSVRIAGTFTNSTVDARLVPNNGGGLWNLFGPVTFTGNTVRFPSGSVALFNGGESADIVACDNNTYYIAADAVFVRGFDAGSGAQDFTFAQWRALGYDTNSTRLDPT